MKNKIVDRKNIEENIVINNDYLKKYIKSISVGCENCDNFDINVVDIVDVHLEITYIPEKGNYICYQTKAGRLEIHKNAAKTVSTFFDDDSTGVEDDFYDDCYMVERLANMGENNLGCDVCVLGLEYLDGKHISVYPPYDALENSRGCEIEMSNCPSFEILDNGNMLLLFGDDSKSARRIDNNYDDLIIGWAGFIGDKKTPEILEVKLINIKNLENDYRAPRLFMNAIITNKHLNKKIIEIVFEDFSDLSFDLYDNCFDKCELHIAQLVSGRIFVKFEYIDLEFECACIRTYENYCKTKISEFEPSDEIYYKALKLELNEKDMESVANSYLAMKGDLFDLALVEKAVKMLAEDKISLNYFKNWLKFYSEVLMYCREFGTEDRNKAIKLSAKLDKLYVNIAYDKSFSQAKSKTDNLRNELKEL